MIRFAHTHRALTQVETIDRAGNRNTYDLNAVQDVDDALTPRNGEPVTDSVREFLEDEGYEYVPPSDVTLIDATGFHAGSDCIRQKAFREPPAVVDTAVWYDAFGDEDDGCYTVEVVTGDNTVEKYNFERIDGEVDECKPVVYVGDSRPSNYISEESIDELPEEVLAELHEEYDVTVMTGVDGGWETWDGRPEWSETYLDVSDAETVEK